MLPKDRKTRPNRRCSAGDIIGCLLAHAGIVLVLYLLISIIFANWYVQVDSDRLSILQIVYRNYQVPGGWGQILRRFRDLRTTGDVDVLIAGSSHAYRSFDPRIFAGRGLRAFNMGTTNQTPLNTYYLLRQFLPDLQPELVLVEVYARTLNNADGLEGFFDLATNLPLSSGIIKMAIATGQPHAVNTLVALQMRRLMKPLSRVRQKNIEDETYVSGGYCESKETIGRGQRFQNFGTTRPAPIQMEYLEKILCFLKDRGISVVMVTAPVPVEHRQAIKNYALVSRRIATLAHRNDVFYRDFNDLLELETYTHFKDTHHLNHAGVQRFNRALLDLLQERDLLPQ
jgi:hypothetical protein